MYFVELLDEARDTIHILKKENLNLVSTLDHKTLMVDNLVRASDVSRDPQDL